MILIRRLPGAVPQAGMEPGLRPFRMNLLSIAPRTDGNTTPLSENERHRRSRVLRRLWKKSAIFSRRDSRCRSRRRPSPARRKIPSALRGTRRTDRDRRWGIAGLAAARRLDQRGQRDFLLLELESTAGGNSTSGRNSVAAYPWGAHYLPLPNDESTEVLALLEELGVLRGRDASGAPIYDEEMLCADPNERMSTRALCVSHGTPVRHESQARDLDFRRA